MVTKKKNPVLTDDEVPTGRTTRTRGAANHANDVLPPLLPLVKPDQKQVAQGKSKRAALDENSNVASLTSGFQHKKRAALRDVTNISSYCSCGRNVPAAILQSKASQRVRPASGKDTQCSKKAPKLAPSITRGAMGSKIVERVQEQVVLESKITSSFLVAEDRLPKNNTGKDWESPSTAVFVEKNSFRVQPGLLSGSQNGDFTSMNIIDIGNDKDNPRMCSFYASEIYTNLHAAELYRRPSCDFMETLQHDITPNMRGMLIDWLVEVSEEYRLVPDTLCLTVYVIDQFLSHNHVERQRLQLLGITCMLIASYTITKGNPLARVKSMPIILSS